MGTWKVPKVCWKFFDADEWADIGLPQEKVDPHSAFNRLARIRLACQEGHAQVDCSRKVAVVTCRKAAPLPGNYKVGDLVSFKREAGSHGDPEENGHRLQGLSVLMDRKLPGDSMSQYRFVCP